MAGISFKLKKMLDKQTLSSTLEVYTIGAILSAGAWLISMLGILIVGKLNIYLYHEVNDTGIYQVLLTYLISLTLIVSSPHHLVITRFSSDCIYTDEEEKIIPNFIGALFLNTFISLGFVLLFEKFFLRGISSDLLLIIVFNFIILSNIWIVNILVSSIKEYKLAILAYFFSYLLIIVISIYIGKFGITYLLLAFLIGNIILFFILLFLVFRNYDLSFFISFEFLKAYKTYWHFVLIGLFFNLAIWADEYTFWYTDITSSVMIGNVRQSVVYDLPVSLAYLSIIPGMAIFFLRLEIDFAIVYEKYFKGVVEGATLAQLFLYKNEMIRILRITIKETLIIQGIFNIFLYLVSKPLFSLLNLPFSALPLFYVDLVATQAQLLVMNLLAFLFYLDRRKEALVVTFVLFVTNASFSKLSIILSPYLYGYGTAASMLIGSGIALIYLRKVVKDLEYETFMLQK